VEALQHREREPRRVGQAVRVRCGLGPRVTEPGAEVQLAPVPPRRIDLIELGEDHRRPGAARRGGGRQERDALGRRLRLDVVERRDRPPDHDGHRVAVARDLHDARAAAVELELELAAVEGEVDHPLVEPAEPRRARAAACATARGERRPGRGALAGRLRARIQRVRRRAAGSGHREQDPPRAHLGTYRSKCRPAREVTIIRWSPLLSIGSPAQTPAPLTEQIAPRSLGAQRAPDGRDMR
jgi:hypothetical protein